MQQPCTGTLPVPDTAHHTAAELMITCPKTLPIQTTVGQARAVFDDQHVHMLLLEHGGILHGALLRTDLLTATSSNERALALATLEDRTAQPDERVAAIGERLVGSGRRLAVVDGTGRLHGLLCLKRDRTGFCTNDGVAARARERNAVAGAVTEGPVRPRT